MLGIAKPRVVEVTAEFRLQDRPNWFALMFTTHLVRSVIKKH